MTYAGPISPSARCLRAAGPADAGERTFAAPLEEDALLSALRLAFRPTGGVVSGEWLAATIRASVEQPISWLAREIVHRRVISFEAQGERWLPIFQFDADGVVVVEGVRQALAELRDVFDDWEVASWFAMPNSWLAGASPADAIGRNARAVVQAARADRFVAMG